MNLSSLRPSRTVLLYAAGWLAAVIVATTVGLIVVRTVGDTVAGDGPVGEEISSAERTAAPAAGGSTDGATEGATTGGPEAVTEAIEDDFGSFTVVCRGAYAEGVTATAATGWNVLSYEPGPDDDVDASFSNGRELVELEVFCNGGQPEVAELERSRVTTG